MTTINYTNKSVILCSYQNNALYVGYKDGLLKLVNDKNNAIKLNIDYIDNEYINIKPINFEDHQFCIDSYSGNILLQHKNNKDNKYIKNIKGTITHINNKEYVLTFDKYKSNSYGPFKIIQDTSSREKLNIILRGHIRKAFQNNELKHVLESLITRFDTKIYLHTWNIIQNSLSYRNISQDLTEVNYEMIFSYLGYHIKPYISNIIIDNDQNIKHIGNISGCVGATQCPVKGYKNMIYGWLKASEHLYYINPNRDERVLQFRWDLFSDSCPFSMSSDHFFYRLNVSKKYNEPINFLYKDVHLGIDNAFHSNVKNMYQFIKYIYTNFDIINNKYKKLKNQEFLFFYEKDNFNI